MGFYGLLEATGVSLSAPPVVILDRAICDLSLWVGSPDAVLEYDPAAWVVDLGVALVIPVADVAYALDVTAEELDLVCPY